MFSLVLASGMFLEVVEGLEEACVRFVKFYLTVLGLQYIARMGLWG